MKQRVCRRLFCMLMTLVALFSTAVHAAGQGIYEKESYAESVTAFAMKKNTQATYDTSLPFAETVKVAPANTVKQAVKNLFFIDFVIFLIPP